jgi:hypothetical protein
MSYAPAYAPCPGCGLEVLVGLTDVGELVPLDVHQQCYTVLWKNNAHHPELRLSRAYPVHKCHATDYAIEAGVEALLHEVGEDV